MIDDTDRSFTGAVHVGLDVPITKQLKVTGRYTATWIDSLEFEAIDTLPFPPGVTTASTSSRIDHFVGIGLR